MNAVKDVKDANELEKVSHAPAAELIAGIFQVKLEVLRRKGMQQRMNMF